MKKPPFDEAYIDQVVETQGALFESLQDSEPFLDGCDFITRYLKSETRRQLDEGHAYYLTLDVRKLKERFLAEVGGTLKPGAPMTGFLPAWLGRFYAYAQWKSGIFSADLVKRLPVEEMAVCYRGAHDLDLKLAVERFL